MRVLVFGDSITQGYWDTTGGWVDRLRKHYDEQQVQNLREHDEPTIFNLGISADTSENILKRIETETVARTRHNIPPIVIIQIGVNDSCTIDGTYLVPMEEYIQNLHTIVTKLRPITAKIIFIGPTACDETKTTPVFWRNIHYTNANIQKYENAMMEVAQQNNIPFTPLFASFRAALEEDKDLLSDGLHPNNEGHEFIANVVGPALEKQFR